MHAGSISIAGKKPCTMTNGHQDKFPPWALALSTFVASALIALPSLPGRMNADALDMYDQALGATTIHHRHAPCIPGLALDQSASSASVSVQTAMAVFIIVDAVAFTSAVQGLGQPRCCALSPLTLSTGTESARRRLQRYLDGRDFSCALRGIIRARASWTDLCPRGAGRARTLHPPRDHPSGACVDLGRVHPCRAKTC